MGVPTAQQLFYARRSQYHTPYCSVRHWRFLTPPDGILVDLRPCRSVREFLPSIRDGCPGPSLQSVAACVNLSLPYGVELSNRSPNRCWCDPDLQFHLCQRALYPLYNLCCSGSIFLSSHLMHALAPAAVAVVGDFSLCTQAGFLLAPSRQEGSSSSNKHCPYWTVP